MNAQPEIVLGITGSIGAYKAADLIRQLREDGYGVTCVMTRRAAEFIAPLSLQALSERKVYTELFSLEEPRIIHTALADQARLVLIAPATANIIGKLANGLADDLLTCIVLATKAKLLLAPAMNVQMYQHSAVQRNILTLKRLGYHVVGPNIGKLACGYEAIGHLAEVEEIIQAVKRLVPVSLLRPAVLATHPAAGASPRPVPRRRARPAKRARRKR